MADEHNSHEQPQRGRFVVSEPGNRYQPHRVIPRAGQDIQNNSKQQTVHHATTPLPTPVNHPSPVSVGNELHTKKHRTASNVKPALPRQGRSQVLKRHMNARAEHHIKQTRSQHRQQLKAFLLGTTIAVIVVGVGTSLVLINRRANNNQAAVSGALGASTTNSVGIDESPVTIASVTAYKTSPDKPKAIRIQRMGLQARIIPVVTSFNGEPAPTSNTHDIGWLANSAKPGQPGVVLLDGYTSGPSQPGALLGMGSLITGDLINIENGDGQTITYKVVRLKTYPSDKVNMQEVSAAVEPGHAGLNIIANTGRFNVRSNQFEDRLAVWATQL